MSKSNFNALVEAKKQRDEIESETETSAAKTAADKKSARAENEPNDTAAAETGEPPENPPSGKRATVRRSYRVAEGHDKAVKVMSKFMNQGTEEEIVLGIFAYFFENQEAGKKALQMVSLLENN